MRYFGIKIPKSSAHDSYIWFITDSEHSSWMSFFSNASKTHEYNAHRMPLEEAIRAYKAIGYKCVELDVTEIEV